jgi:hypothetical protein
VSEPATVAIWISGGSLLVSAVTLFVTWRRGKHIKVRLETLEEGGQPWLTAVVRNPGGVSAQITGWGFGAVIISSAGTRRYLLIPQVAVVSGLRTPCPMNCGLPHT